MKNIFSSILENGQLSIARNANSYGAILTVFEIIGQLKDLEIAENSGSDIESAGLEEGPKRGVKLDFNAEVLETKIILWHLRTKADFLHLDKEETTLLKKVCNTSYYYYVLYKDKFAVSKSNKLAEFFNFLHPVVIDLQE